VLNKNLSEDLQYERELNEKMRSEINRHEIEKGRLLIMTKEQEEKAKAIASESQTISSNLRRQEDELKKLEDEKLYILSQMKDKNNEMDKMREYQVGSIKEKQKLKTDIGHIEDERNDLIFRMNDLTNKYEQYVGSMTKEREEMANTSKKHIKLLTSKILGSHFHKILHKHATQSFAQLRRYTNLDSRKERQSRKMFSIFASYYSDTLKDSFRMWVRNSLNWLKEKKRTDNLVQNLYQVKLKRNCFTVWKNVHQDIKENWDSKKESVSTMKRLVRGFDKKKIAYVFLNWKECLNYEKRRENALKKTLLRRYIKFLNNALLRWENFNKGVDERIKFESLAMELTQVSFLRAVFNAFKDGIRQSKIERYIVKYRCWKKWKIAQKKMEITKRSYIISLKLENLRNEQLMKKVFDELKVNTAAQKFVKKDNELKIEKPLRQQLERTLQNCEEKSYTQKQTQAVRRFGLHLSRNLHSYYYKWKYEAFYYKKKLPRVGKMMITYLRKRLSHYFYLWKTVLSEDLIDSIKSATFQTQQEAEMLGNKNINLANQLKEVKTRNMDQKRKKMRTQLKTVEKYIVRGKFRHWAKYTGRLNNIKRNTLGLDKLLRRSILKNNLYRYKRQVLKINRGIMAENRSNFLLAKHNKCIMSKVLTTLQFYSTKLRRARKMIKRGIAKITIDRCRRHFLKWKDWRDAQLHMELEFVHRQGKNENSELHSNIEELESIVDERKQSIEELANKIKSNLRKILENFASKYKRENTKSFIKKWYNWAMIEKKHFTLIKKYMWRWQNFKILIAFKKWKDMLGDTRLTEEFSKTKQMRMKRKLFKQATKMSLSDLESEGDECETQLDTLKKQADKMSKIYNKSLVTLMKRVDSMQYVSIVRSTMEGWHHTVQREKHLGKKMRNISKRYLLGYVLIKMKNLSIQETDADEFQHQNTRLFKLFYKAQMKRCFDTWKSNLFTSAVMEFTSFSEDHNTAIQDKNTGIKRVRFKTADKTVRSENSVKIDKFFYHWRTFSKTQKILREKTLNTKCTLDHERIRSRLAHWRKISKSSKTQKLHLRKADRHHRIQVLNRFFSNWSITHTSNRIFPICLVKIGEKLLEKQLTNTVKIFTNHTQAAVVQRHLVKKRGECRIANVLSKVVYPRLIQTLGELRLRSKNRVMNDELFRKLFSHVAANKNRCYFNKWKQNARHIQVTDYMKV
jgi:hypothetical protein